MPDYGALSTNLREAEQATRHEAALLESLAVSVGCTRHNVAHLGVIEQAIRDDGAHLDPNPALEQNELADMEANIVRVQDKNDAISTRIANMARVLFNIRNLSVIFVLIVVFLFLRHWLLGL